MTTTESAATLTLAKAMFLASTAQFKGYAGPRRSGKTTLGAMELAAAVELPRPLAPRQSPTTVGVVAVSPELAMEAVRSAVLARLDRFFHRVETRHDGSLVVEDRSLDIPLPLATFVFSRGSSLRRGTPFTHAWFDDVPPSLDAIWSLPRGCRLIVTQDEGDARPSGFEWHAEPDEAA